MVAALNIVATLILMVMEKHKDIAILVSMGASRGAIQRIFMLQGTLIGAAGTLTGGVLGWAACRLLDHFKLIRVPVDVYQIAYVPFKLLPGDAAVVVAGAVLVCFLATLHPRAAPPGWTPPRRCATSRAAATARRRPGPPAEEVHQRRGRTHAVGHLAPAVPLVGEQDVLDGHAAPLQAGHHLLRLHHRHVGVVGAVLDHERRLDAVELVDGRELRAAGRPGVAGSPYSTVEMAAIQGSVCCEERLEVDDAEEVGPGGEEVGVLGQTGHRHVAAVRAAHDAEPLAGRRCPARRGSRRRP